MNGLQTQKEISTWRLEKMVAEMIDREWQKSRVIASIV